MGAKSRNQKGRAQVPAWWMECTPHSLLDYDPDADRRKREAARKRALEQQLLSSSQRGVPGLMNMVGADGKPIPFDEMAGGYSDPNYFGPESSGWPKNEKNEPYDYAQPTFALSDEQRKLLIDAGYVPTLHGWTAPKWDQGGDLNHVEGSYANADGHGWEKPAWTKANLRTTRTGEKIRKGRYSAAGEDALLGPPALPGQVATEPAPAPIAAPAPAPVVQEREITLVMDEAPAPAPVVQEREITLVMDEAPAPVVQEREITLVMDEEEVIEEEIIEESVHEEEIIEEVVVDNNAPSDGMTSVELVERAMALEEDADKAAILKGYLMPSSTRTGIISPPDLLDGVARVAKKYRLMNMKDNVDACRHVAIICRLVILKVYGEGSEEVKNFQEGLRPAFV